jgi:hypothetical protein
MRWIFNVNVMTGARGMAFNSLWPMAFGLCSDIAFELDELLNSKHLFSFFSAKGSISN